MKLENYISRERLGEIVRFGIIGVLATALQYAVYWLLLWLGDHATVLGSGGKAAYPTLALTIGYVVSFVFNFFASTRYTFRVKATARRGAGFALSHAVNYLLQMLLLNLFLWMGIQKQWAPLPVFCICVPVNFLLVRFFLKNEKK